MSPESHVRALLIDHCWTIYLLLTENFSPPPIFHLEFPTLVERTLVSHVFHLTLDLTEQHTLYLREEYEFTEHHLAVGSYSYTLKGQADIPLLRADSLPHHRTDFRKQPLTSFPHHLHDHKAHVQSFTGQLNDFIALVKPHVAKPD